MELEIKVVHITQSPIVYKIFISKAGDNFIPHLCKPCCYILLVCMFHLKSSINNKNIHKISNQAI